MRKLAILSFITLSLSAVTAAADPGPAFIQQIGSRALGHAGEVSMQSLSGASANDIRHMEKALLDDFRERFGDAGGIAIDQRGDFQIANISQEEGAGNIAAVEQRGAGHLVTLTQSGNMNVAAISQWGSSNVTRGVQIGDGNYARISQRSFGNSVRFSQSGAGNVLTVSQD